MPLLSPRMKVAGSLFPEPTSGLRSQGARRCLSRNVRMAALSSMSSGVLPPNPYAAWHGFEDVQLGVDPGG
jgi:hypothetical protein